MYKYFWKSMYSDRVIATNVIMVPENWIEINKEEFDKLVLLRNK